MAYSRSEVQQGGRQVTAYIKREAWWHSDENNIFRGTALHTEYLKQCHNTDTFSLTDFATFVIATLMQQFVVIVLCFSMLVNGCKTPTEPQPGDIPQPNWLERRMDRLETWNRRHGYPIEKARDATKTVVVCTVVAVGAAACIVGYLVLKSELDKYPDPTVTFNDPSWVLGR
ncbi:MAG TPA: hypothetical protein PLN21_06535 [Gemmatales bacterium]|nr:hypothetical protein [Gemmatales bacterium]